MDLAKHNTSGSPLVHTSIKALFTLEGLHQWSVKETVTVLAQETCTCGCGLQPLSKSTRAADSALLKGN